MTNSYRIGWNLFARLHVADMIAWGYPIADCIEYCMKHGISFKLNANGMQLI